MGDSTTRECRGCGTAFVAKRKDSTTCSRHCWYVARGTLLPAPLPQSTCALPSCGATFQPRSTKQECCSEAHGRSYWRVKAKAAGTYSNGSPEAKRRSDRKRTQWRRAKLRDPAAEQIDRDDIGDRDGWGCGLCGSPVDQALTYPHPDSPSLDHVVPLSRGGLHVESNVQISHLTCNVRKGARVA